MAKRPKLPRPVRVKEVVQGILSPGDTDDLELRPTSAGSGRQ